MEHIKRFNEMVGIAKPTMDDLVSMDFDQFTSFMKNADAIDEKDFFAKFDYSSLVAIMKNAVRDGYEVDVKKLSKNKCNGMYVKYVDSKYGNVCVIEAFGNYSELPFMYDRILS